MSERNARIPTPEETAEAQRRDVTRAVSITNACLFFERLNNTLQRKVNIKVNPSGNKKHNAPAHVVREGATMARIGFDFPAIYVYADYDPSLFFALLRGFNYHELAHVAHTPRPSIKTPYDSIRYQTQRHKDAFEILEDGRIEAKDGKAYAHRGRYFALLSHIFHPVDTTRPATGYAVKVVRGSFLSAASVTAARAACVAKYGEQIAHEIDDITARYLKISDTDAVNGEGHRIALELAQILDTEENESKTEPTEGDGSGDGQDGDTNTRGSVARTKEVQDAFKALESQTMEDAQEINGTFDPFEEDKTAPNMRILPDAGIEAGAGDYERSFMPLYDPPEIDDTARELARELRRMTARILPRTVTHLKHGRLNLRRAMNETHTDGRDFKRRIDNLKNDARVCVSILVDSSGSMDNTQYQEAANAARMVCRAVELAGGLCAVVDFSGANERRPSGIFKVIKRVHEQSDKVMWGRRLSGGTRPTGALVWCRDNVTAQRMAEGIPARNDVLFLFTDGAIDDTHTVTRIVDDRAAAGMQSVLIRIGAAARPIGCFACSAHVADSRQTRAVMVDVIRDTVARAVNAAQGGYPPLGGYAPPPLGSLSNRDFKFF